PWDLRRLNVSVRQQKHNHWGPMRLDQPKSKTPSNGSLGTRRKAAACLCRLAKLCGRKVACQLRAVSPTSAHRRARRNEILLPDPTACRRFSHVLEIAALAEQGEPCARCVP